MIGAEKTLKSGNCDLAAAIARQKNKAMDLGHLFSPSQSSASFTHPELAGDPRRNCFSECQVREHTISSPEN